MDAAPPPQQAYQQAPPDSGDLMANLEKLGNLHASGVLTDAEFEAQKARLLSG